MRYKNENTYDLLTGPSLQHPIPKPGRELINGNKIDGSRDSRCPATTFASWKHGRATLAMEIILTTGGNDTPL